MRRRAATVVSAAASVGILVWLYRGMDVQLIGRTLLGANPAWLILSVGLIVPITVLRAIRFRWVTPPGALPGVGEALRLTLVATALNVFMPAKSGDLIKSYFVATRSDTSAGVALAIIVYERLCDLAALITWCLLGWLVGRPDVAGMPSAFWPLLALLGGVCGVLVSSERVAVWVRAVVAAALPSGRLDKVRDLTSGWPDLLGLLRGRRRWIVSFSLLLWLSHLCQIWLFTLVLAAQVPFTVCASLTAVALMAGQLPLTISGIGTRDVALVVLLSHYMTPETAAAMGILIATRGLLPPLLGLPVMRPYLSTVMSDARRWRQEARRGR